MTPPSDERKSVPSMEDDPTGIQSIPTKMLLQGLREDSKEARDEVREMRKELAGISGVALAIQDRQTDLAKHILDQGRELAELREGLRAHQAEETVRQVKHEAEIGKLATQMGLVAPLVAQHEQVLQQTKGAITASRLAYGLLMLIGGGGVVALAKLFMH